MRLRFAVSPIWETVAGLRLLARAHAPHPHAEWLSWAAGKLAALPGDRSALSALVARADIPEFLIPTPGNRMAGFDAELEALTWTTTPERVTGALGAQAGLLAAPDAVPRLQERLRAVHDAVIRPVWAQVEGVLQGDLERRGQRLLDAGPPAVLGELHPDVTFESLRLVVSGRAITPGERDLVLLPSAFVWPGTHLRDSPLRLGLHYPARGFGSVWQRSCRVTGDGLDRLLGGTRAALLRALERPVSVSELAGSLGVTAGAVSQHLGVLRAAGLAVSRREGREVVSLRTALGVALLRGEV